MPELETLLRDARPDWPEPSVAAEARARAALGVGPPPRSPRAWLGRTARARGARLLIPAALLLTAGAAVAATLITSSSGGAPAGRPASLAFGPVEVAGAPVSVIDGPPVVAVDGGGTVVVAWARAGRVVVSARRPGGGWSAPEPVSDATRRATQPAVGADRAGAVTIVWRERTAATRVSETYTLPSGKPAGTLDDVVGERWAVVSRTRAADGRWSAPERLSADRSSPRDIEWPALVLAPDGLATVAWDEGGRVLARVRRAGGPWSEARAIGDGDGEAVDVRLAGSRTGAAIASWSNRITVAPGRRYVVQAAVLDERGRWGPAETVADDPVDPPNAVPAIGPDGTAAVAWIAEGDATVTTAAVRPAGAGWSPAERVDRTSRLFGLRGSPAVGGDGRVVVVSGPRGAAVIREGDAWRPLRLSPLDRRAFGVGALTDAAGGVIVARGTRDVPGLALERVGGPDAPARIPGAGLAALAAGDDGTTAAAWIAGASPQVRVAVAEGGR